MKVLPYDLGACGMMQFMHAGTIQHDTEDADTGAVLCTLPANTMVLGAVVDVTTAFSEAATLTVGADEEVKDLVGDSAVTATAAGSTTVNGVKTIREDTEIKAKLGGSPSAGVADVYLVIVRIPAE